MAIDSAAKRASFFKHGGRFWKGTAVVPDGSIDFADRMHYMTFYNGNTFAAIPVTTGDIYILDRHFVLPEN